MDKIVCVWPKRSPAQTLIFGYIQSELEVNAQTRRMQLLEEEMQRVSERLDETVSKLDVAEKAAEESERGRKVIESR